MKMRQLKGEIAKYGVDISERMVKYYIEIGLVPMPTHPHVNQAEYTQFHIFRLAKIGLLKKNDIAFHTIKDIIMQDNEYIKKTANILGVTFEEALNKPSILAKEEFSLSKLCKDKISVSRDEMMRLSGADKIIIDLAVETGALDEKDEYDRSDYSTLLAIKHMLTIDGSCEDTSIVAKISDLSKLVSACNQLANVINNSDINKWIYIHTMEQIMENKLH